MDNKPLIDIRYINDLKDMLEQSERIYGSKNAFYVKTSNDTYEGITFTQFKNDVDAFGTAMIDLGLKGKYIGVIGENSYKWCLSYLSVVNGTGIVVPLDKELPLQEIQNLVDRSEACALVFSSKLEAEIQSLLPSLKTVKYFINMDALEDSQWYLSLDKLILKGQQLISTGDRSFLDAKINREEMSILLFTSGTTDKSKGVMLSHKNLASNIMSVCSVIHVYSEDSSLSILPLHHTYECTCDFLLLIYNGATLSFNEGLKHIAKNFKETSPSVVFLVPLILENMYKKIWDTASKKFGLKTKLKVALFISDILLNVFKIDLRKKFFKQIHDNIGGRIRLIVSGAAALEPSVCKGFRSMGIQVLQGYGLTECSPIVTANREENYRDSSIGLPITNVQVRVNNPDSDGIGELVTKGDNVMLGYFKNEEATAKILKDGWLYTGDLGYMDADGFFYITGRQKNVIVTKNGKNIYPEEIEAYINKSPYVLESMVLGDLDEKSGETYVKAIIVPNFEEVKQRLGNENPAIEELNEILKREIKLINNNLPLYKYIRHFTIREEEFEKTTTKKIKRHAMK